MTDTDHTPADAVETGADAAIGYAEAMIELDDILAELDDDAIDIDVLSERVERAAELIAVCRGRISAAQAKVADIVETLDASSDGAEG